MKKLNRIGCLIVVLIGLVLFGCGGDDDGGGSSSGGKGTGTSGNSQTSTPTPTPSPTSTPTPTPTPTPEPTPITDDNILNSIDMNFKFIYAGTFAMGSPEDEPYRESNETQHTVALKRSFYIQTTEVTQEQWEAVMGEGTNPSHFSECGDDCPVEQVSWFDCVIFCNRLSQREGLTPSYYADNTYATVFTGTPPVSSGDVYWKPDANGYRLPTEAQWEYAARAGSTIAFANGPITQMNGDYDPNLDAMGWYIYNSEYRTQLVAQKDSNAWGLFDMHGNVMEWCQDWYSDYPSGTVTGPVWPSSRSSRVFRGGAWNGPAWYCRSAARFRGGPDVRGGHLGFRLALPSGR